MTQGEDPSEALQREAEAWVVTLSSGSATRADADALERWRAKSPEHEDAFRCAARFWRDLGEAVTPARRSTGRRPSPDRRALLGGGLAAVGVGVVMLRHPPLDLWPSLAELSADHRTPPGGRESVTLSGSLSARLNTRTALSRVGDDIRLLSGEALFDTTRKQDSRILAGDAGITLTDARLNVRILDDDGVVACLAGSATVACGGQRAILAAGQRVAFSKDRLGAVGTVDARRTVAWLDGLLIFDADPLGTVIDEINRYRSTPVLLRDRGLAGKPISGVFNIDALDAAVTHLARVQNARLTQLPGGFLIIS